MPKNPRQIINIHKHAIQACSKCNVSWTHHTCKAVDLGTGWPSAQCIKSKSRTSLKHYKVGAQLKSQKMILPLYIRQSHIYILFSIHTPWDPRSHRVMLCKLAYAWKQNLPHIQTFAFLKAKRILQLQMQPTLTPCHRADQIQWK